MRSSYDQLPDIYYESSRRIIQTPGELARRAFYYVQETGYLKLKKSHRASRKNLPSYLLVLVLSGSGILMSDGEKYPLQSGNCFFIDCTHPYYHESSADNPWELLWVHFYGSASAEYYSCFREHSLPAFTPNCFNELKMRLEELFLLNEASDLRAEIESSRLIVEILSLLLLEITEKEADEEPGQIKQREIRAWLDEHYLEKFSLEELSERFFISKYHLSRQFKRYCGSSPNRYVIGKRITHAKKLLRFSDYSLEEVARESGFYDASYFNKQFRKAEGISPADYRRKWMN
ncbi:MAG: helix-turn-helix domain-containing protein [Lachnospiraceae bacterium]|nr:helix-turn-helix domain-containing protein [Lachnospiraceae bacterium]